ncbi:UDP-2,4-diacetamido-2,4,6-trideoxy-beta-L-altropyranose hydrolase [Halalkalibacter sp. AB-rgal2]|uniref:UDP-2,4-diacetamido-2,4, 6-trideoxy-beta-L-altropyranose hydrolase n=1 Tax=Halalkalibacter sp. AB-rgal2 TaxID=3242695 RepID=UPI00359D185C
MNVCIRVDSSEQIGTGHVFRCLTLAKQLCDQGSHVTFAQRIQNGDMLSFLRKQQYEVIELADVQDWDEEKDANHFLQQIDRDFDWVIVDHYQLSYVWEKRVGDGLQARIAVIDDLANRKHDCELLLDQNYFSQYEVRYKNLVPDHCKLFLGPAYLILRDEFKHGRHNALGEKRILVFFGGSDPTNETEKVLLALDQSEVDGWEVDVVVGTANPNRDKIQREADRLGYHYHCQIDYLADLMSRATFSFGAGGVTMWERCYVGIPSYVTIVAENQRQSTMDADAFGAVKLIGWHDDVGVEEYVHALREAFNHEEGLKDIRQKGWDLLKSSRESDIHPVVLEMMKWKSNERC